MSALPVFAPESPQAKAITDLFSLLLVICAIILALVSFLIVYALVRYRANGQTTEPPQIRGNRTVEIAWTLGPFLLLVHIFVATARAMTRADPAPGNREPDLLVIGHQWWWEARYRASGVIAANELHIPTGRAWLVRLESADVIHDFWVPALSRKTDVVPGHPNTMWVQANRPGVYLGFCAEYCGSQHAGMRFRIVAQNPEDFAQWERSQLRPPPPAAPALAAGEKLFRELTCANCHAIGTPPAGPQPAPDLTHLASRRMLAADVVENTPANLRRWLADPQAVKPGSLMPNLRLSATQVEALADYLESLK